MTTWDDYEGPDRDPQDEYVGTGIDGRGVYSTYRSHVSGQSYKVREGDGQR